jgi:hypothetical protein
MASAPPGGPAAIGTSGGAHGLASGGGETLLEVVWPNDQTMNQGKATLPVL